MTINFLGLSRFIEEFHREVNRQAGKHDMDSDRIERDIEKTERDIQRVIEAIKAGVPGAAVKDEMTTLEDRHTDLRSQLESTPAPIPRLHPNLAEVYRKKVANLAEALNEKNTRANAAQAVLSKGNRPVRALAGKSQQGRKAVKRTAQKDIAI